jgi:hypothetical protein
MLDGGTMSRWDRFKEGFVSVWRLLYTDEPEGVDWYAQVGRILGVIAVYSLWLYVGKALVWMIT